MIHKEFWGLIFLGFVAWVILASDPTARINRGCRPIHWGGNLVVSLTALALPSQQSGVKKWVDKVEYGCRYSAWRLFYEEDYKEALERQQQASAALNAPPAQPQEASSDETASSASTSQ